MSLSRIFRRRASRVLVFLFVGLLIVLFALPGSSSSRFSQYFPGGSYAPPKTVLQYGKNGLAGNWTLGDRIHPIEELMERGRIKWANLLRRQSKTLEEAVDTYRRRYGRNPPKGFDKWWAWARENNVKILDDYDQVHSDTNLFWALSPETFRKKCQALKTQDSSFITHLDPHGPSWSDGVNPNFRADDLMDLLEPIAQYLPDYVEFTTSTHDLGSLIIGDDQKVFLEEKIAKGEYATEEELRPFEDGNRHRDRGVPGLASACPEDSPAWLESLRIHESGGKPKGPRPELIPVDAQHPFLIHDQKATYDYCYNTELIKFHGGLSWDAPKGPVMRPMFHQSKFYRNAEIVLTPLDYYYNATLRGAQNQFLSWEEKDIAKLHWRGKATGDSYSHRDDFNWRNSHRVRLHRMTHEKEGSKEIYVKSRRTGGWELQRWETKTINEAYTDVGLTDGPMQCSKEDGTCQEMQEQIDWSPRVEPSIAAKYKYVIDVDGNGWSSRFHRLLLSGSVNLKSTIYPEFFTDWLIPWYHYVPIQPSYSELYLILSFFIGVPGSPSTGHDDLAQEIAENGRKFAMEHWRWEDMQSYMFRLLLEYIRLGKDDREAWEYAS
ncbi:glycosyl transferase family 90-domain-containing protein [Papiliotrema laurentii]|uniref:Glycosyl transferase family 90-domain-containing protein n=1 Tax=Papiliotrema laurentii TaxID=5418 RepID=A0AAD9CY49_PAPLA|nr:glycosyl transferase family 90-domain-containing protein [Papiliotrema laurentii]